MELHSKTRALCVSTTNTTQVTRSASTTENNYDECSYKYILRNVTKKKWE